jgi:hypothetical protein
MFSKAMLLAQRTEALQQIEDMIDNNMYRYSKQDIQDVRDEIAEIDEALKLD